MPSEIDKREAQRPRVRWTFHGTIATPSYQHTFKWLERFVGCVALEFSDLGPPVSRLGGCCWLADGQVEIAEANAPDTSMARFLDRIGTGYINLALQVDDLENADRWFSLHRAKPSLPPSDHFTFTRPTDTCGLQFQWSDLSDLAWDPRQSGAKPSRATSLIEVSRIAYWGAMVDDPRACIARFQELWQAKVLVEDYSAPNSRIVAAVSLADGVLALYRRPQTLDEECALWGSRVGRPHFHLVALRVDDLRAVEAILTRENIGIRRRDEETGELLTQREATGGIAIAWTDRDVPHDPRGKI